VGLDRNDLFALFDQPIPGMTREKIIKDYWWR
jgi:hypothetical protein